MIHSKNIFKITPTLLKNKSSVSGVSSFLNVRNRFCSTTSSTGTGKDKEGEDVFKLDDIYKTIEKDLDPTLKVTDTTLEGVSSATTSKTEIPTTTIKKGRPKGSKNKIIQTTKPITPITTTTTTPPPKNNTVTNNIKPTSIPTNKNYSIQFIPQDKDRESKLDNFIKENPGLLEPLIDNIINTVEAHNMNSNELTDNDNITNNNNTSNSTVSDINSAINQLLGQIKPPTNKHQSQLNNNSNNNEKQMKFNLKEEMMGEDNLLPKDIVKALDEYIIGQPEAKRAVSIALRNRWRRKRLDPSIRSDVYPKNILMVGPTGVGKTEMARRLAKIVNAPFVKVEATKYTEVGYHGPDVDTIIRDLIEASIANIKARIADSHKASIEADIEKDILTALIGPHSDYSGVTYEDLAKKYRSKQMDSIEIEIDVPIENSNKSNGGNGSPIQFDGGDNSFIKLIMPNLNNNGNDKQMKKRRVTIYEARDILEKLYREKYAVTQDITRLAVHAAEQNGIVFLDEIDKICTPRDSVKNGGDASTDGVQRDLLPIIEGCNVTTKYGMVDTSRILFIASGAFHSSKPSDLISELQGRLPIRVELKPLEQSDFYKILTEPKNNQIQQQKALLKTEDIELIFTQDALLEVSKIAFEANAQVQNLGARRLHGIIERIVEELSFNCDVHKGKTVILDSNDVKKHLTDLLFKTDLSKYII